MLFFPFLIFSIYKDKKMYLKECLYYALPSE